MTDRTKRPIKRGGKSPPPEPARRRKAESPSRAKQEAPAGRSTPRLEVSRRPSGTTPIPRRRSDPLGAIYVRSERVMRGVSKRGPRGPLNLAPSPAEVREKIIVFGAPSESSSVRLHLAPINPAFLLLTTMAFLIALGLRTQYITSPDPVDRAYAEGATIYLRMGIAALVAYLLLKMPLLFRSANPKWEKIDDKIVLWTVGTTIISAFAGFSVMLLLGIMPALTTTTAKFGYFLTSAIVEEVLFRAVILTGSYIILVVAGFGDRSAGWFSILFSAALFTAFHLLSAEYRADLRYLLVPAVWGVIWGFAYYRSKSLFPSVIAHMVVNMFAVGGALQGGLGILLS